MGFCIFNNAAIAAAHALTHYRLQRVAICDFDVHHGNGTENIFLDDSRVLLCSTFQHPFYPFSGTDTRRGHIINVPMPAGTASACFRTLVQKRWLSALDVFEPQLIIVSAGFDAHRDDDMSQIQLMDHDYAWVTEQIREIALRHAAGRIVSVLEGGYELHALGRSVVAHLRVLMGDA
jgi:acetoin utilization deacetylase AcuC-like enzyme